MTYSVALITGAAQRVGAHISRTLHQHGWQIAIHYHTSAKAAEALSVELNNIRADSAIIVQADLADTSQLPGLIEETHHKWGRLNALINNASTFYPTPLTDATENNWDDLFNVNAKAAFFLIKAAVPYLKTVQGTIINMVDIHAERPLKNHPIYCMAKAALTALTKALAKDLAPEIRVNAVAPGVILWAASETEEKIRKSIINRIALQREGSPQDIADTILFLLNQNYITGQIISVDGGRLLTI